MSTVVVIACSKSKLPNAAKARDLYTGNLFKKSLQYAGLLKPDAIYILSAKHHLLHLDEQVEPYDLTLNKMHAAERRQWAEEVVAQLRQVADLDRDKFILLAGERYITYLLPHMKRYEIPMEGLTQGRRGHFLKEQIAVV